MGAVDCQALCVGHADCGAYEFCRGSNCDGDCNLFPDAAQYTSTNGYPGVECFVKQVLVRPNGIRGECCDHGDYKHGDHVNGSSSTCLPPECESPAIHFTM